MRRMIAVGVISAALAATGCATGGSGSPEGAFQTSDSPPVSVRVDNLNFNEATLWALGEGGRRRLGIVGGKSVKSFRIPWTRTGRLRIRIDLLSGGDFTTNPLSVDPGDQLDLIIESPLRRSILR